MIREWGGLLHMVYHMICEYSCVRRDHTGSLSPNGHFEHEDSPEDLGVPFFRQNHINIFHFVSLLLESDMILESDMVEPNDIDTT